MSAPFATRVSKAHSHPTSPITPGVSIDSLKEAEVDARELKDVGFGLDEIKGAGFTIEELKVGYTIKEMMNGGEFYT